MKNENPFIRKRNEILPLGHNADRINNISVATDDVLKYLLEALEIEQEPVLRKVVILKLLKLLNTETCLLADELEKIASRLGVAFHKKNLDEALKWRLQH